MKVRDTVIGKRTTFQEKRVRILSVPHSRRTEGDMKKSLSKNEKDLFSNLINFLSFFKGD